MATNLTDEDARHVPGDDDERHLERERDHNSQKPLPQASITCGKLDGVKATPATTTMTVAIRAKMKASGIQRSVQSVIASAVCAIPSFTFAQEQLSGGSSRLRAPLNPVIAVDASGHAELERGAGTNDRFTAEVEIAKDDFDVLDITPGNGFGDEVVLLRVNLPHVSPVL